MLGFGLCFLSCLRPSQINRKRETEQDCHRNQRIRRGPLALRDGEDEQLQGVLQEVVEPHGEGAEAVEEAEVAETEGADEDAVVEGDGHAADEGLDEVADDLTRYICA